MRKIRQAYSFQKKNAKQRGVRWRFTFQDWCAWWEINLGPDWFKKRGRGRGKYCMARFADRGIYSPRNVKCILNEENNREQIVRPNYDSKNAGAKNGRSKLTESKVRDIRSSKLPTSTLAKKHSVSINLIQKILRRDLWPHVI